MKVSSLAKRGENGACRCTGCDKMLGRVSDDNGEMVEIRISKGKNRFMSYRIRNGAVSVRCICGNVNFLTKKRIFDI